MKRNSPAFTLAELVVGMAILSMVLVLMVSITGQISGISQRSGRQIAGRQEMRALFGMMRRDLEAAVLPFDPTSQNSFQFVVNPAALSPVYHQPDSLFFQTRAATGAGAANLSAVGYFVRWNHSGERADLFRFQANASDPARFLLYLKPDNWIPEERLSEITLPVAENVRALYVQCFRRTPEGSLERMSDSRATGSLPAEIVISLLTGESRDSGVTRDDLTPHYDGTENASELYERLSPKLQRLVRVHQAYLTPAISPQ